MSAQRAEAGRRPAAPVSGPPAVDAAGPPRVLRIGRVVSLPVRPRQLAVVGLLVVALFVVAALTLSLGELGVRPDRLLSGWAELAPGEQFSLRRLRGPRLAVAVTAGAGLGVAGALFQTVTRNPLGSPDVIGLAAGASAGAAGFGLLWPGLLPVPAGALVGAAAAMALVYLGTGQGFASPSRILIVGVGVNAMALAFVHWVVARVSREEATVLAAYLSGSTAARSWEDARFMAAALALLLPVAAALGRRLRLIEMGDEVCEALGAPARATRVSAVLAALALAAAAVTVVGPVGFVALTAPQVARRLTRAGGANVAASAATGAVILGTADLIVQHGPFAATLPVGVLTGAVGGCYLGYLLVHEWRRASA